MVVVQLPQVGESRCLPTLLVEMYLGRFCDKAGSCVVLMLILVPLRTSVVIIMYLRSIRIHSVFVVTV